jgi:hypothetical protein
MDLLLIFAFVILFLVELASVPEDSQTYTDVVVDTKINTNKLHKCKHRMCKHCHENQLHHTRVKKCKLYTLHEH